MQTVIPKTLFNYLPQLNRLTTLIKQTPKLGSKSKNRDTINERAFEPDEILNKMAMNEWMNQINHYDEVNDIE